MEIKLFSRGLSILCCQAALKVSGIIACNFLIARAELREKDPRMMLGEMQSVISYRASNSSLKIKQHTESSCTPRAGDGNDVFNNAAPLRCSEQALTGMWVGWFRTIFLTIYNHICASPGPPQKKNLCIWTYCYIIVFVKCYLFICVT